MRICFTALVLLLPVTAALADRITLPDDSREAALSARQSFNQGDFTFAEELYEQILAKHPDNIYALSNLGVVEFRVGKYDLAEGNLKRAITLAPGDAFSYCTLGIIYYQEKKFDAAYRMLSRALNLSPGDKDAAGYIDLIRELRKESQPPPAGVWPGLPGSICEIGRCHWKWQPAASSGRMLG